LNPLAAIYGAFVWARNRSYDRGVLKSHRLSGPVISVGSLSSGGAGKTPFVILLGQLLKQQGISFDVLSRGYGRKTRGVLEVVPDGSAREFGDEPLLIAKILGCPVVVGDSRYQAGLFAEAKFAHQLHILDDGFQHRSLARDFDIVLLTPEDVRDERLPGGRLRETLSSLRRADAVVQIGDADYFPSGVNESRIWRVRRTISFADPPSRAVVFCGIARPQQFVEQLGAAGIELAARKFYRDHHAYTETDLRDLLNLRDRTHAGGFITTEKDAINLGPHVHQLEPLTIARVVMELQQAADALDTILRAIAEPRPQA
jgi:tetraacyldisaccharide 4'-kinase